MVGADILTRQVRAAHMAVLPSSVRDVEPPRSLAVAAMAARSSLSDRGAALYGIHGSKRWQHSGRVIGNYRSPAQRIRAAVKTGRETGGNASLAPRPINKCDPAYCRPAAIQTRGIWNGLYRALGRAHPGGQYVDGIP